MLRSLADQLREFRFIAFLAILAITAPSIYSFDSAEGLRSISICSGNTNDDADAGIQAVISHTDINVAEGPDSEDEAESVVFAGFLRLNTHISLASSGQAHPKEEAEIPLFILFHCLKVFTSI